MLLLVADDNDINLKVACAYLKALGIPSDSIVTVTNGGDAVKYCLEKKIDLVFMDIQMPEMDGLEATKLILDSDCLKPIIVALTANSLIQSEQDYLAAGMQMVIRKPVNKGAFEAALALLPAAKAQSSLSLSSNPVLDLS